MFQPKRSKIHSLFKYRIKRENTFYKKSFLDQLFLQINMK